jgi:membrane protein YqaA with SNARE-associated domain
VQRQRIGVWIIAVVAACAALGAWAGSHLGDGHLGMVVLIGATCGVLGSFLPGSVTWVLGRVRRSRRPRQGAA